MRQKKHLQSNNHNIGNKSIQSESNPVIELKDKHKRERKRNAIGPSDTINDYMHLILFYWSFMTNRFVNGVKLRKDFRTFFFSACFYVIGLFSGITNPMINDLIRRFY